MARDEIGYFHWADYLVLIFSLVVTIAIGIFYAVRDRKKQNNEDFLMAGRNMSIAPVTASTFASLVSCMGFIAFPVEVYYFGLSYIFIGVGCSFAMIPVAMFIAPAFHKAKVVSAFQYLETSFNASVRKAASIIQVILMFFFMGTLAYAPAVALAQVSGISRALGILLTTIVGTFYTAFGGMKAVVWSNVSQVVMMYAGVLILSFKAIADLGGFGKAFTIIHTGGRLTNFNFSPDPFVRSSVWCYLIGSFGQTFMQLSSTQIAIQRYGTLPKVRDVKISIYLIIPMYMSLTVVILLTGLSIYGHFATCDPVLNGDVETVDQLVPYLVMKVLGPWPGMPGMFIACIYAAGLSTLSAGMNGIAAVVQEDIIQPLFLKKTKKPMTDKMAFYGAKVIIIIVGVLVTGMAMLILSMKGDLFSLVMTFMGTLTGPVAGLFTIAIVFPKTKDVKCVITGFCVAVVIGVINSTGSQIYRATPSGLPLTTAGCYLIENGTFWNNTEHVTTMLHSALAQEITIAPPPTVKHSGLTKLFNLNPLYYSVVGFLTTVCVALLMDTIKKSMKRRREQKAEKVVIHEKVTYSPISLNGEYSWKKENPNRLSVLPSVVMKMKDQSCQTYQSIPSSVIQEILWVHDKESTL